MLRSQWHLQVVVSSSGSSSDNSSSDEAVRPQTGAAKKAREATKKLRQQLTEAGKNIKASKKELAGSKKELAEEKRRFCNWRARHREDPLAVAFTAANGKSGKSKSKELDKLLKTYLEQKCPHRSECQEQ